MDKLIIVIVFLYLYGENLKFHKMNRNAHNINNKLAVAMATQFSAI